MNLKNSRDGFMKLNIKYKMLRSTLSLTLSMKYKLDMILSILILNSKKRLNQDLQVWGKCSLESKVMVNWG